MVLPGLPWEETKSIRAIASQFQPSLLASVKYTMSYTAAPAWVLWGVSKKHYDQGSTNEAISLRRRLNETRFKLYLVEYALHKQASSEHT